MPMQNKPAGIQIQSNIVDMLKGLPQTQRDGIGTVVLQMTEMARVALDIPSTVLQQLEATPDSVPPGIKAYIIAGFERIRATADSEFRMMIQAMRQNAAADRAAKIVLTDAPSPPAENPAPGPVEVPRVDGSQS